MKKLLIITYYWPPSGGGGVQRWLKFVKYLNQFGWDPIVYTVENGEYPIHDESLAKDIPEGTEIIKTPIWEPYNLYKAFTGKKKDYKITTAEVSKKENSGMLNNLSIWLRGNLFIPDPRMFWIKPSIKYLTKYIQENQVDAIVSSGPPHSMHLIAEGVKKKTNLPWMADFRDPWTQIDFFHDLKLSKLAHRKHEKLEKKVLKNADLTITVSPTIVEQLKELGAKNVELITNGFDSDDFENSEIPLLKEFTVTYIGSMGKDRNPDALWKAIQTLQKENIKVNVQLIGKTDPSVFEEIEKHGIQDQVNHIDYLPHGELLSYQKSASLLLLTINNTPTAKGILTGKLFEYIATFRPIVCLGPHDGDAAKLIEENQFGKNFDYQEVTPLVDHLKNCYQLHQNGNLINEQGDVSKYSRKELTRSLTDLLNDMTK